jgi:nitrate reductase gamma subunit
VIQNVTPRGPITPTIIEVIEEPASSIDMIQVAIAAFNLTGVIMAGAAVAGLVAGVAFIWYRRRRPASTIEARGYDHNFFRAR